MALAIGGAARSGGWRRLVAALMLVLLAGVSIKVLGGERAETSAGAQVQSSLLRVGDSRTAVWNIAGDNWRQRPVQGFGAGAYPFDTANSYLKLLVDLGLVGVVVCAPLVFAQARTFWSGSRGKAALVAGGAVNAFFEGWLFAAGSLFFLMYWIQVSSEE